MPKHKLFCFDCRTTKRTILIALTDWELSRPSHTCQHCGKDMIETYNYPTPKRHDDKGWRKLERRIAKFSKERERELRSSNAIYVANKMYEQRKQL